MPKPMPEKDPAERIIARFDFSKRATSISGPVAQAVVISGTDADPSAIISGAPVINGTSVLQAYAGGVAGVNYGVSMQVTTDTGEVLVLAGILPVRTKVYSVC